MNSTISFQATETVSTELVRDLLVTAFEGGSNYWVAEVHIARLPAGMRRKDYPYWHAELPLVNGGKVRFHDLNGPDHRWCDSIGYYTLDFDGILKGLAAMRLKYPDSWKEAIDGTFDAITADVFLQCCIFGEVVYG